MRSGFFLLIMTLSTVAVFGQPGVEGTEPHLSIIEHSWVKERINWGSNALTAPSVGSNRTRNRAPSAVRKKQASEQRSTRITTSARKPVEEPRYLFTYELVVKNNSSKRIREVDWDYVFTDTGTREELGRRQFTSAEKIAAGKKKKLSVRVPSPPTHKISAHNLGKNERAGLTEEVVIVRVLFDDGSVWQVTEVPVQAK